MIIEYDKSPNATVDRKIQSLINSMQRAIDELEKKNVELERKIEEMNYG